MKITVIGPGRWGSCITWYLDRIGNDVVKAMLNLGKKYGVELPICEAVNSCYLLQFII